MGKTQTITPYFNPINPNSALGLNHNYAVKPKFRIRNNADHRECCNISLELCRPKLK
ncbi:MAG: hypothetical protein Q4A56_06330 [Porphyromonadaceae bacterium]|nr:hypothetical protein [Porphyromonadaceae bacterium]